jgi:hypothetical protein
MGILTLQISVIKDLQGAGIRDGQGLRGGRWGCIRRRKFMSSINWTKFYDLYVQNEHFKVFIVKDDNNCFHAGCLWYEVQRVLRVPGEPGDFRVAFETRVDTNEQAALDQLKAWVTSQFGKDFKLVPSK